MSRPQKSFWTLPWPQKEPIRAPKSKNRPKKIKNYPKIKLKSKVRIEKTIEKKFFNYMSRPQNSFELFLNPKNSPLGPQKVKNDHKIKSK